MAVKMIAVSFGYAEEHSVAWVVFNNDYREFGSPAEALEDLALNLLRVFDPDLLEAPDPNPCCLETREKIPTAKVCATCGTRIAGDGDDDWDEEQFEGWLRGFPSESCNSLGLDFENLSDWTPFLHLSDMLDAPTEQVVIVPEAAERVLLKALDPEALPKSRRAVLDRWWTYVRERGKSRADYRAEWDEGVFNW